MARIRPSSRSSQHDADPVETGRDPGGYGGRSGTGARLLIRAMRTGRRLFGERGRPWPAEKRLDVAEPVPERTDFANQERVLRPVGRRADELLAERALPPLPTGVTPHKLRHTFASILVALGRNPAYVMAAARALPKALTRPRRRRSRDGRFQFRA